MFHRATDRAAAREGYPGIGLHRREEESYMGRKTIPWSPWLLGADLGSCHEPTWHLSFREGYPCTS